MRRKRNQQLFQSTIDQDRRFLEFLKTLTDYVPIKSELSLENLNLLEAEMLKDSQDELPANDQVAALWAIHDASSKALYDALFGGTIDDVMNGKTHTTA